jgi:DNA-binding response OmpR family regulator
MASIKRKKSKNILIVEDEKPMAKALVHACSHAGFTVSVAYDGKKALDTLIKESFDLIVLDLLMPTMDGFAFLKEIIKQNIHVPVIVLTNLSKREELEQAQELGAVKCFIKSNTPLTKLIDHIRAFLN